MRFALGKVLISTPYNLPDFFNNGYQLHIEIYNNKVLAFLEGNYEEIKIGEEPLHLKSKIPIKNIRKFIIDVRTPIIGSDISVEVYVST